MLDAISSMWPIFTRDRRQVDAPPAEPDNAPGPFQTWIKTLVSPVPHHVTYYTRLSEQEAVDHFHRITNIAGVEVTLTSSASGYAHLTASMRRCTRATSSG
jgi:hypothetical protein